MSSFRTGGGRQHHVGVQAGTRHAEIERYHQIQLAFAALLAPFHFLRHHAALLAEIFP